MNDLFDKKITVRILSVALAIMLWLYVITEQNPVIYKDLNIPVKLINVESLLKNDLVLLDDESYSVSIKLKGNKNYLDRLNKTTVSASADLKGINSKGLMELPIDIDGIPVGVDISWISSNKITLNVDNIISETIPVSLKVMGNTIHGTATMIPVISPSEVVVKGAETILNTIKSAEVSVDISNSDSEVNKKLAVQIIDTQGNFIEGLDINPKQVDVTIPVENTKSVLIDADYKIMTAEGYVLTDVSINPKTINIVGKKELLDGLSKLVTEKIELVDAKTFIEKEITLILPEGIELANKDEKIVFSANIEKIAEKIIESNSVGIKNLNENFETEILPIYLKATVRGPESLVNAWDINNAFYVDLKDLEEGTYNLPILYVKPEQIELKDLYPNEIKVTLKKKE